MIFEAFDTAFRGDGDSFKFECAVASVERPTHTNCIGQSYEAAPKPKSSTVSSCNRRAGLSKLLAELPSVSKDTQVPRAKPKPKSKSLSTAPQKAASFADPEELARPSAKASSSFRARPPAEVSEESARMTRTSDSVISG